MVKILKFDKEMLNKVRDEVNLFIFENKTFKTSDLVIVNKIVEELKNVKVCLNY